MLKNLARRSEKSMEYKAVLTSQTKAHFRGIINYLFYELENPQAAPSVADDFDKTVELLSSAADSLSLP